MGGIGVAAVFFVLLMLALYFLPTIIAVSRKHQSAGAIIALNILLGWTVLGWIGALIWSLTGVTQPQTIVVQNTVAPPLSAGPISPPPLAQTNSFDPLALAKYGEQALRGGLQGLSVEQLRNVASRYGMDSSGQFGGWGRDEIIAHIVRQSLQMIGTG